MDWPWYTLMMAAGLGVSAVIWSGRFKSRPEMVVVYVTGLLGALLGAKLGYVVVELYTHYGEGDFWRHALVGRTILGALLGGYLGVEGGKKLAGYGEPTGDVFALAVPVGVMLGRVGCLLHGCCQGVACSGGWWAVTGVDGLVRWPAAWVEFGFNAAAALVLWVLYRAGAFKHQLFHLYLMGYALFRIAHEPMRDTPRVVWGVSGYQVLALVLGVFTVWRYLARRGGALRGGPVAGE